MDYLLYFAGPFALALAGRKLLCQPARVFGLGLLGFLAAWTIDRAATSTGAWIFGFAGRSFGYAAATALAAGVLEEAARYLIFSRCEAFRGNWNGRAGFMYALGHHGMETLLLGIAVLLATSFATFSLETWLDPLTAQHGRHLADLGSWPRLYHAVQSLTVGLLVQVSFSGTVMLALVLRRSHWVIVAMAWHTLHDIAQYAIQRLSDSWVASAIWTTGIAVAYSMAAVQIYRRLARVEPVAELASATSAAILPGRTGVPEKSRPVVRGS